MNRTVYAFVGAAVLLIESAESLLLTETADKYFCGRNLSGTTQFECGNPVWLVQGLLR